MHQILKNLLLQRGIEESHLSEFIQPDFMNGLHDGSLMKGMDLAVERIQNALQRGETIGVFGDYDADGVPATAVLVRAFRRIGKEVFPFIPSREEGYGLTSDAVQKIISAEINLLITVDNGTVSETEISELKMAGIDTIVCDHHQPQSGHLATSALAILNPKQEGCPYPFKELCGCALGWKLMHELYKRLGRNSELLKWELDLVAIATIADMVPLIGENRIFAIFGLRVLHLTRNEGLKAIVSEAGKDLSSLSSGDIGFQIAPRLNAPSRMHAETIDRKHVSLQVLITDNPIEAQSLAHYLQNQNAERQTLLQDHLDEAIIQAKNHGDDLCLVVYAKSWSAGVIGLVAGRLLELYKRPVIVLAEEGAIIKGSVRSVDGVNAVDLLSAGSAYLEKFGGHAKAAGLSFKPGGQVEKFRQSLQVYLKGEDLSITELEKRCLKKPDAELGLSEVSLSLAEDIATLEPFGIGFPTPLFLSVCQINNCRQVGAEKKHMSCFLEDGGTQIKAIGFQMSGNALNSGDSYRVSYTISCDVWNGSKQLSCHIKHISAV